MPKIILNEHEQGIGRLSGGSGRRRKPEFKPASQKERYSQPEALERKAQPPD